MGTRESAKLEAWHIAWFRKETGHFMPSQVYAIEFLSFSSSAFSSKFGPTPAQKIIRQLVANAVSHYLESMYLKISESHRILLVPSQEKFTRPFVFLP
jgi:hypothetical protein